MNSVLQLVDQVSVSSGEEQTECWHAHNNIDKLDDKCAGKMFNFNFIVVVQSHEMVENRGDIRTEKF